MKKTLLFSALTTLTSFSFGQITLDLGDFGSIGDEVVVARDTAGLGIDVGPEGTNQTWDFSNLLIYSYSENHFGNPDTIAESVSFPDADITYHSSSNASFFDTDNSKLDLLGTFGDLGGLLNGQQTGIIVDVPFANPQRILNEPTNYLDQVSDTTRFVKAVAGADIGFPQIDSIRVNHTGYATYEIDAWGEMILLNDTEDVLRKHRIEYLVDSVFIYNSTFGVWFLLPPEQSFGFLDENPRLDTLVSYDWYAKDRDYAMVTVNTETDGTIRDVLFLADKMLISSASSNSITCNGAADGSATATVVDLGQSPYTYAWDDPMSQTTQTATNLGPGTYTVTITDVNGKMGISSVTVVEPTAVNVTNVISDATCYSCGDGQINVGVTGGTPTYSYTWSPNVSSTSIASNLDGGTYYLTVTDANNCLALDTFYVEYAVVLTETVGDPTCIGNCDGTISVDVDGESPYTYTWSNGATNAMLTGLCAGTYTVTVTDNNGVTATTSATLTEPTALSLSSTVTDIICEGDSTGSVSVSVSGGTPSYVYSWSTANGSGDMATNLVEGTYYVSVTDANSCETLIDTLQVANQGVQVSLTLDQIADAQCTTCPTGFISLTTSGGDLSYTYSWDNGLSNEDIINLLPGSYTVTVTDGNGCATTETYDVGAWPNSVENLKENLGFSYFPSPTTGVVYLKGVEQIALYNVLGEEVFVQRGLNQHSDVIDISSLEDGVYFITKLNENSRSASKIVLRK